MESSFHGMGALFAQLGLPSDAAAIEQFVHTHHLAPSAAALYKAPFWSPAQAALLREAIEDDADWAEAVDQLDALLRH